MTPETKQWTYRILMGMAVGAVLLSIIAWMNGQATLGRSEPLYVIGALVFLLLSGVLWYRIRYESQTSNKPKRKANR